MRKSIVDFFQNPLPAANVNRLMGSRDILKEISTACKNAGIKVIARVDFRGVEKHVYNKLPDWFMKDAEQEFLVALKAADGRYDDATYNLKLCRSLTASIMSDYKLAAD